MQQQRTSVLPKIGLMFLAVVAWLGYRLFSKPRDDYKLTPETEAYLRGNMPKLPGPFLAKGDPKDLKFEGIDLGISVPKNISEQGDSLYLWFGEPKSETFTDVDGFKRTRSILPNPTYRIMFANGQIKGFPSGVEVRLSRSGEVFEIKGEGSNAVVSTLGRQIQLSKNSLSYYPSPTEVFTSEGIFGANSSSQAFLFSKDFRTSESKIFDDPFISFRTSSSKLGAVGLASPKAYWDRVNNQYQLAVVKDGGPQYYRLPPGLKQGGVSAARDCVYLFQGPHDPTNLYRFESGQFSKVPLPPDAVGITSQCGNSKGDMLIRMDFLDRQSKGAKDFPYIHRAFYVSDGKFYDLSELCEKMGIHSEVSTELDDYYGPSSRIDENGNFLMQVPTATYPHTYLMRRLR